MTDIIVCNHCHREIDIKTIGGNPNQCGIYRGEITGICPYKKYLQQEQETVSAEKMMDLVKWATGQNDKWEP